MLFVRPRDLTAKAQVSSRCMVEAIDRHEVQTGSRVEHIQLLCRPVRALPAATGFVSPTP
jgi:hypothetical protein